MLNRKLKRVVLMLAVAAGLGLGVSKANATLTVTLSEPGYAPVSVNDTATPGTADLFTSYGTFTTNFVLGYTNEPNPGGDTQAILQITSLDITSLVTSPVGHTLTISLMETGFTFPGATGSTLFMNSSLGGTLTTPTAGDTVTFQSTALTPAPVSTMLQTYVSPGLTTGTTSFQEPNAMTAFVNPGVYGLDNVTTITLNNIGEQANLSGTTTISLTPAIVPEPVSGVGAMLCLAGLTLRRGRRIA